MATIDTFALPLLPLSTGVVLPGMVVTLALETPEAIAAVEAAQHADGQVVLVPRFGAPSPAADAGHRGGGTGATLSGRYARLGTVARVEQVGQMSGGVRAAVVRGLHRAVIGAGVTGTGEALWVSLEPAEETAPTARAEELAREYRVVVESILEHRGAGRLTDLLQGVTDPGALADTAGYWPELSIDRKVELLETVDVEARLAKVVGWARDSLAELELKERIRTDVADGMERTQKEFLLRQQMAAIKKELGELDGGSGGSDDYRTRLESLTAPEAVRTAVEKEIDRLERTNEQSPEGGWIRTWLDTVFDLPWGIQSEDRLDVGAARATLDADRSEERRVGKECR